MNWHRMLMGDESWMFLIEILVRTVIILFLLFIGLRMTGKRGLKQLSVFELLIIISLGTAAGDPMIYKEVGIAFSLMAFLVVFAGYKIVTYIIASSKKLEDILEGKPFYIIYEGKVSKQSLEHHELAMDEFYSELRNQNVYHLGQIEAGIIETSGELSLLFYKEKNIKPGLPMWPHILKNKTEIVPETGTYACTYCGNTQQFTSGGSGLCGYCRKNKEWVKAVDGKGDDDPHTRMS